MKRTNRNAGVRPGTLLASGWFSINRKGLSSISGVTRYGGYQAHALRNIVSTQDLLTAYNIAWNAAEHYSSWAGVDADKRTLLLEKSNTWHMRNNFSQDCYVKIYKLYPRTRMSADDIANWRKDGATTTTPLTYQLLACPTVSNSGGDTVPDEWFTKDPHPGVNATADVLQGKPYLWEWAPQREAAFQKMFKIKCVRARRLAPGQEMLYKAAVRNFMFNKRKLGITTAGDYNQAGGAIFIPGMPLFMISVKGSLVHSEPEVATNMSNINLKPTYGDFNLDVVERVLIRSMTGAAPTYQNENRASYAGTLQGGQSIVLAGLDQWVDQAPTEVGADV